MYSSFESVANILDTTKSVNDFLIDATSYYAHIPPKGSTTNQPPELLAEHIELVQEKFIKLTASHQIDSVIDSLIHDLLHCNQIIDIEKTGNYVKKLFVHTIVFHDFGKINENFQIEKMNNPFFKGKEQPKSPISTHHSSLGAYVFIVKHFDEITKIFTKQEQGFLFLCTLIFSYPIFKHHAKYLGDKVQQKIAFTPSEVDCMKKYIANYQYLIDDRLFASVLHTEKMFAAPFYGKYINSFALYALTRLSFSLLTGSDYLASGQYMTGVAIKDFGILTNDRIQQIYDFVANSKWLNEIDKRPNYNQNTYQKIGQYALQNPKEQSNENLNTLRQEMAIEVITNIRANKDSNLFYIEAPTGGGKTNLSMLAAIELLKANEGVVNKVFYVFPFTTLITQTYKAIIETLGLKENEITQLHSKAGYQINDSEEKEDGHFGKEKKNYIDNLFVNYPFCLLTHVKFFDLLKTNEKKSNYLLHRLANSIVVIDELQSYNPAHWDKLIYFIRNYAKHFNIKFILMSATLPKLGNLNVLQNEVQDFVYLLPNAKKDYFLNPNFRNRVTFNFDLFSEKIDLETLAARVLEASKAYSIKDFGMPKPKNSVYTIVEFIFKRAATDFYTIIDAQNDGFFDEIFVLSGTILEHRRRHIINYLKNTTNRKKRILLITTQVVEAGVDIDMDLGFKDKSLIDSDEQLAGRINRNVNKQDCTLYLFDYNKERILYGKDKRYEVMKGVKQTEYERILKEKDFDTLYNKVLKNIYEWNNKEMAIGFKEYEEKIKQLQFQSVHFDFKLIDQENISCFIPLHVPISVHGQSEGIADAIFSKNELSFLEKNKVHPNENNEISGEQVFNIYIDLITNKQEFIAQETATKTLQGIMSKFVFSMFKTSNIETQLIHYYHKDKSEYGYMYIQRWNEFYDVEFGLDHHSFNSSDTQFL